jgi:TATA-binding protein-associated factor
MHLLAELYSQPELDSRTVVEKPSLLDLNQTSVEDLSGGGRGVGGPADTSSFLSNLAPRLWLFMRHNIATVRLAAIRTLV